MIIKDLTVSFSRSLASFIPDLVLVNSLDSYLQAVGTSDIIGGVVSTVGIILIVYLMREYRSEKKTFRKSQYPGDAIEVLISLISIVMSVLLFGIGIYVILFI